MVELTLTGLVGNRTMSAEMAATLAVAAEERRSLLFVAVPRMAGKSTTMLATLQHVPPGTPIHLLSRAKGPRLGIPSNPDGGYLLASEIADTAFDDYLWGDEVRTMFAALKHDDFSVVRERAYCLGRGFESPRASPTEVRGTQTTRPGTRRPQL